jgi:hypothetical protein
MPVESMTTHISADMEKLYERAFITEQTQTTLSQVELQPRSREESWRQIAPLVQARYGYNPTVIRFYEDIITELQQQVSQYRAIINELVRAQIEDSEVEYATGTPTVLPPNLAKRMSDQTSPPSPMTGHEI